MKLRVKLSLAFLMMAAILLLIVSVMTNVLLEKQFRQYVISRQENRNRAIVALLSERYRAWGGMWDAQGLESVGVDTMGEGLLLRVKDSSGIVLWDATVHNNGMCQAILASMAKTMERHNPGFQGEYEEKTYPVLFDGVKVGAVDVGYYGPYFYSDIDIQYLNTINGLLIWAALVSAVAAVALGFLLARQLTRPIAGVVEASRRIAEGDYSKPLVSSSNTTEIVELTTSTNRLAQTLAGQEALRRRLTADVAHELRTPVATLQSHLEAMIDGVWEADAERLGSCHEEVVRLSRIVGDLEKLTRAEGDALVLHKKKLDLSVLLNRLVLHHQGEFRRKDVSLSLETGDAVIEADEDKISQVFVNLLSNALQYTPEGGSVVVRTVVSDEAVEVAVCDTGIGIGQEDLPHIFERFYRTDPSRARRTGGAGIGLAIVQAIVEAHHGSVRIESEVGVGSTFTVRLPR